MVEEVSIFVAKLVAGTLLRKVIDYAVVKWKEKERELKQFIIEYLDAAVKDDEIKNTDAVILKPKIFELLNIINKLSKEKNPTRLEALAYEYATFLKEICVTLPYNHLVEILTLKREKPPVNNVHFDMANIFLLLFERLTEKHLDINHENESQFKKILSQWEHKLEIIKKSIEHIEKVPQVGLSDKNYYNALLLLTKGQLYYARATHPIYFSTNDDILDRFESIVGYLIRALHFFKIAKKHLDGLFLTNCKALECWAKIELYQLIFNLIYLEKLRVLNEALKNGTLSVERSSTLMRYYNRAQPELFLNKIEHLSSKIKKKIDKYSKLNRIKYKTRSGDSLISEMNGSKFEYIVKWSEKKIKKYEEK